MKHKLQNLLKHNWRTLLLLLTLITTSQGSWAWDNCRIHGQFGSNKDWTTSENIACGNSVPYDLSVGTYEFGVKSNNDTWLTIGTQTISSSVKGYLFYQGSGNVTLNATVAGTYTFKCVACQNDGIKLDITFPHATIKGTFCNWVDQDLPYTVSLEANTSYQFGVTAIDNNFYKNASITSANCTNVTLSASGENATIQTTYAGDYTFTWDDESKQISVTYPPAPCDSYSAPADVVNGTDIMLYAYQHYNEDKQVGITNNSTTCLGTPTMVGDKKHSVIQVASSEFSTPFQIYVSNNCGSWKGETCNEWNNQSALDAKGSYYKHESSGKSKVAATTVTVTPSSTSIPVDTESIDLSITGNSTTSSYGSDLFALIYVDDTKDGCMAVSTSAQTYELTTSSLSAGSHTIKTILTDGTIYYIGNSFTLTVTSCTAPIITVQPSGSWQKCGNADGRQLSITATGGSGTLTYQWYRNTTNTLTDGVADLTGATAVTDMVEGGNTYSPSASDYGVFYYCCVVRSGGACSANKATSVYTGEIEIKQTPTVKPSTITVKQYEPVRLQATNSSVNWSITAYPGGAAADEYYLYDDTKSSAMFKGKTGSYTITATSTGSDCTSTSAITVNNDDSEGC